MLGDRLKRTPAERPAGRNYSSSSAENAHHCAFSHHCEKRERGYMHGQNALSPLISWKSCFNKTGRSFQNLNKEQNKPEKVCRFLPAAAPVSLFPAYTFDKITCRIRS